MTRPFDIVGFDLDGTLVDTSGDLTAAVNHALDNAGRASLTPEQVRPMIGGGGETMLRRALDATGGCDLAAFPELHAAMIAFYARNLTTHSRPFPGVRAALDALAVRGVTLAVVTNKRQTLAQAVLDDLGLASRFACIIGGDTLGGDNAKPSAAPIHAMIARSGGGSAAFVGDSIYDVQAARNAGIPSVAVSFGFVVGSVEDLGADAVIDHFDQLVATLDRLSAA